MRSRLALEEGRASQLPANMIHWLPLKMELFNYAFPKRAME